MKRFFVGLHQPSNAQHFSSSFISVNRLRNRRGLVTGGQWIMDSGAFTEISKHGGYRHSVEEYAESVKRWNAHPDCVGVVSQDYMCEPFILEKTGMTVGEHQRLTIERYDTLLHAAPGCNILPVLQGYQPAEYADHLEQYGERFPLNSWVGVGSVCKRNSTPDSVFQVLSAIKSVRPDLNLHGFGLKITALKASCIRELLFSADSMAWSYHARMHGRDGNDWREAKKFEERIFELMA